MQYGRDRSDHQNEFHSPRRPGYQAQRIPKEQLERYRQEDGLPAATGRRKKKPPRPPAPGPPTPTKPKPTITREKIMNAMHDETVNAQSVYGTKPYYASDFSHMETYFPWYNERSSAVQFLNKQLGPNAIYSKLTNEELNDAVNSTEIFTLDDLYQHLDATGFDFLKNDV